MKRSTDRIITTQVGSLPRPNDLRKLWDDRLAGRPYDKDAFSSRVKSAVAEMVHGQVDAGIDVISDGEQGRLGWTAFLPERLAGFEERPISTPGGGGGVTGRERQKGQFDGYLAERGRLAAMGEGREYVPTPEAVQALRTQTVCVGPVSHKGMSFVQQEIDNFKAALSEVQVTEAFLPSVGPDNMGYLPGQNEYYSNQEDFLRACAKAIREEYKAILDAGFVLQIDTPVMKFNALGMDVESFRKRFGLLVEVFNETLAGLPEDMIRLHLCYGGGRGPHSEDVTLPEFVDLLLQVKAAGLSFDQNPRHEWEWEIWKDTKLPDGKVLIPGCVGHTNDVIEHPELVRQRIVRLANLVGRENVIAGSDCGFAQSVFGPKIHPDLVWAKFQTLAEGARLATKELWGR
ncbi:MAG TPA: methionine synthase [Dehalococcoidia bacterium]|nr:methionine synthase [Dehalococcoidia bacterium]